MTYLEDRKILAVLTGPPGVGKSTVGRMLAGNLASLGIRAEFIDEYQFMREYAENNREDHGLVSWGETSFTLTPYAYNFVTAYSSVKVAQAARDLFLGDDVNVVVFEGARGAFGVDNYRDHLFNPAFEVFSDVSGFRLANLKVSVSDIAENRRRMQVRFEENQGFAAVAPPWILDRYINQDTGAPWADPVAELGSFNLEGVVLMNKTVLNDGDLPQIEREVGLIARELCEQSGFIEGLNGGSTGKRL